MTARSGLNTIKPSDVFVSFCMVVTNTAPVAIHRPELPAAVRIKNTRDAHVIGRLDTIPEN